MAFYGIGSMYGSTEEKLSEFIKHGRAFVGYSQSDSPYIYEMLKSIKVGDIVFVKSFSGPNGLYLKAVGIVISSNLEKDLSLGFSIPVKWYWVMKDESERIPLGKIADKADHMRGGTLYEEFNPDVKLEVIKKLEDGIKV